MKKPGTKNIGASVRQRLLNKARETGRPFSELLQYFAMERFLYRLSKSKYADKFVLKGALMLAAWNAPLLRPTMDIDLLGQIGNDIGAMAVIVREICARHVEPDDGLVFDAATVQGERIAEAAEYEGVRIRFRATLDAARIQMQVDVGFGDIVVPAAVPTIYPTILDLPAPHLLAYSRETAIAEKFEAMVKLGELNSRMKDFFDIWLLSSSFDFDGQRLSEAIEKTFKRRGTALPDGEPVALTARFSGDSQKRKQWAGFIRRMKLRDTPALAEIVDELVEFLVPPMRAALKSEQFNLGWICLERKWRSERS
jgi:predicted nucleotidyltransferase component of viral defense system